MALSKFKFIGSLVGVGIILVTVFTVAEAFFARSVVAATAVKACAGSHNGVNCSAGAAYDGSVICNDGSRDTSVAFSSISSCKASALKCPIYLSPSDYDKQKKSLQDTVNAIQTSNKKLCQDNFNALEALNQQMYEACTGNQAVSGTQTGDLNLCEKNKAKTAEFDKNNLDVCLHSSDELVAKYKTMTACLSPVADKNATSYGALGYILPDLHPAYSGLCSAYGPIAFFNQTDARCYCPNAWGWDSTNKYCIPSPPCAMGSSRVNDQCVSDTKICMEKYGFNVYSATLPDNSHECRCTEGFVWNSAKTACIVASAPKQEVVRTTCKSGFVLNESTNICVSGASYCKIRFGGHSTFGAKKKDCVCAEGYLRDAYNQCNDRIPVKPYTVSTYKDLYQCPVVANKLTKKYYLKGGATIKNFLVSNKECFATEIEAKLSGYNKS